ncbi:MAG: glycosyltransferase family 39 protein [Clostridiales bacterium]|nr:glycosyltransferase family 39 protein [Clostridiales bacterium]
MNKKFTLTRLICIVTAIFLMAGTLTLGAVNLFGTNSLYSADAAILGSTVSAIVHTYITWGSFLTGAAVLVIVSIVMCAMLQLAAGERTWKFGFFALAAAFLARAAAVMLWKIEPESDFALTYELSRLLAATPPDRWGTALDECGTIYNTIWSAHMPFIIYQSAIVRLFGPSVIMLGMVNALWGTVECAVAAALAKCLFGAAQGANALLFMAFNPVCIFFTPVLSNQHPAVCFFLMAVYVLCRRPFGKLWLGALLAGIMLAIGQLLRPEMSAAAAGLTVYIIYEGICDKKKLYSLLCCVLLLMSFFVLPATVDKELSDEGIIHNSMLEQNMKYKIAVGLDKETEGGWSAENEALLYDEDKLDAVFNQRLRNLSPPLLIRKVIYQFGSYVYTWSMKSEEHPVITSLAVRRAASAMMGMLCVFACMTMVFDNEKRRSIAALFMTLGVYMAVYALIEVQVRYNYTVIPIITILGSDIILVKSKKRKG